MRGHWYKTTVMLTMVLMLAGCGGDNSGFTPSDRPSPSSAAGDGFMNIPDGIDEELPFN